MEKYNMLALSTGHVSGDTATLMDIDKCGLIIYEKEGYGWFVHIPEPFDENKESIPKDLYKCITLARKQGCDWIMFDCDVEPIDELPVYEL